MHAQSAATAVRAAATRQRRPRDEGLETRLQTLLSEDLASEGRNLAVVVQRGCGTVEVRLLGPTARLTLSFDAQEAQPARVRLAVRAGVARYRSSLGAAPRHPEREGGRC